MGHPRAEDTDVLANYTENMKAGKELKYSNMYMYVQNLIMLKHVPPNKQKTNKLHGLSPRANYTDRATASRRSDCQLLRIEGAKWSA
jgi:hypothetical protein